MIAVGIVGYGYWGPNLVRNFAGIGSTAARMVVDCDQRRLAVAAQRHPGIATSTDLRALLARTDIDAVAIATPVSTHYDLALKALRAGKHVFIEKPLAGTAEQAERLIAEADARGLLLHVDHTFVYTGAVRKIKELVAGGEIGTLYYYDSVRVNLGLFQSDVDVMWDLAVHDLSIMDHCFPATPLAVSASGVNHVHASPANIAFLTVFFEENCIAHVHVNWLAPVKVRRTLVGGSRKMIVYDDLEPSEKIKVYEKGIVTGNGNGNGNGEGNWEQRIGYRTGDMWAPKLEVTEALTIEIRHFAECIEKGCPTMSDGHAGLRVVQILEAATRSLSERGRPVKIGWKGRGGAL